MLRSSVAPWHRFRPDAPLLVLPWPSRLEAATIRGRYSKSRNVQHAIQFPLHYGA